MKERLVNIAAYVATPLLTALIIGTTALNCCHRTDEPVRDTANTYTEDSIIVRTPVGHVREGRYPYALFPGEIYINGHHHPVLKAGDTIGVRLSKGQYLEVTPETPRKTMFITNTGEEIEE